MVSGSFMTVLRCDIKMSGGPEEVHVRACDHDKTDLYNQDGLNEDLFLYLCEYGRAHFSKRNTFKLREKRNCRSDKKEKRSKITTQT